VGGADRARRLVRRPPLAAHRRAHPPAHAARPPGRHLQGRDGRLALRQRLGARELDLVVCGALLWILAATTLWNAATYPPIGGFDAREHIEYAETLFESGGLPEAGASYTPPGFYVLAGAATEAGDALGLDEPERGALYLNVVFTVATGLLVVWLGRLLFPGRPVVRWAALAAFAACPVVLKTTAMFHPQPLVMLLTTLALAICARMIVQRRYDVAQWALLAVTLAAAQLVRSVAIWAAVLAVLALVVAAVAQPGHRRRIRNALALAVAAAVLIPLPWYLHNQATGASPVLGRGLPVVSFAAAWPIEFYVSSGLPDVVGAPHRGSLPPRFFPLLYADTWGDYFGIWSWGPPRPELSPEVNRRLVVQSVAGLLPTAVAIAGWLALLGLSLARWRTAPERLLVGLAPLLGVLAVLYYATRGANTDGDIVKSMFMLPAAPFWALSLGFGVDVLLARHRRTGLLLAGVLGGCAVVCLSFGVYAFVS
jgi:4-amino-4-deoxy-L-arabinose transferase-like glycosyltransferase